MKNIRVLQLGSPSGLYGAERWILALIKSLDPKKVTSIVGSVRDVPGRAVPICQMAADAGFETVIFDSFGRLSMKAVSLLREYIRKEGIEILHTHGYKTDLLGMLSVRGTACRIITTPHGWTQDPDWKLRIYEWLDRLIFPFLDAVIPLSEALQKPLKRFPGMKNKLHCIPNGVDIKEIEAVTEVAEEIKAWNEQQHMVLGYIGRLTSGKGLDTLFSALTLPESKNWRVAIIGEGEQERELKALCKSLSLCDRVVFFGFRPDRLAFLKGFDAFVLPSRSEGIPRCLMEAMAAQVPVVASDIPGCRYLVDHERTGLLFAVDQAEALAKSLSRLVSEESLRERLVKEAYNHVGACYSATKMAREYSILYEQLMENIDSKARYK